MVDAFHVLQERPQVGHVAHIAARKEHTCIETGGISGAQVIQDADVVTGSGEVVSQRRPDESRAARNKKSHGPIITQRGSQHQPSGCWSGVTRRGDD